MDFFALPDVFLRRVMKTVSIRDRMRLRLVSRSFERLVASTHAGYFPRATIMPSNGRQIGTPRRSDDLQIRLSLSVGGEALRSVIPSSELEQYLTHWNRLFSGITIADFQYYIDDTFDLTALRKFTSKFKIRVIQSIPSGIEQLERALQFISGFPASAYTMDLWFLLSEETLLSLPPLFKLKLSPPEPISSELLMTLFAAHQNLHLRNVILTSADLLKILQDLSSDRRMRTIQLEANCSTVARCLRSYGISEASNEGDRTGEFEIICVLRSSNGMKLRYRKCDIDIDNLYWMSNTFNSVLHITV